MARYFEVQTQALITKLAEELKNVEGITPPAWAAYAKTGPNNERPPQTQDWWYFRAAALLRKVALTGPIGTQKLRTALGSRKRRGHKPAEFRKTGGSAIRKVLQQLQKAGLVRYKDKGVRKGRIATPQGISFLDKAAKGIQ